jgi:hypothetical protein
MSSTDLLIYGEVHHFKEASSLCAEYARKNKAFIFLESSYSCKFVFDSQNPTASYFQHPFPKNAKCVENPLYSYVVGTLNRYEEYKFGLQKVIENNWISQDGVNLFRFYNRSNAQYHGLLSPEKLQTENNFCRSMGDENFSKDVEGCQTLLDTEEHGELLEMFWKRRMDITKRVWDLIRQEEGLAKDLKFPMEWSQSDFNEFRSILSHLRSKKMFQSIRESPWKRGKKVAVLGRNHAEWLQSHIFSDPRFTRWKFVMHETDSRPDFESVQKLKNYLNAR